MRRTYHVGSMICPGTWVQCLISVMVLAQCVAESGRPSWPSHLDKFGNLGMKLNLKVVSLEEGEILPEEAVCHGMSLLLVELQTRSTTGMEWFLLPRMSVGYCNGTWTAFDFEGPPIFKSDILKTQRRQWQFKKKIIAHRLPYDIFYFSFHKMLTHKKQNKTNWCSWLD